VDVKITSPRPEFIKQTQPQQLLIGGNSVAPPPYQPNLIDLNHDDDTNPFGRQSTDSVPPPHDNYDGMADYPPEKKSVSY